MEINELLPQDFIDECMKTDSGTDILLACAGYVIEHKRGELERELELIDKKEKMKILEREKRNKDLFDVVKYD